MAERMRDFSEIGNHDGVELTEVWKKFKWGSSSEDEYFIENKVSVGQKRGFFGKYSYIDDAEAMFKALDLRFAHIRAVLSAAGASYEYDSSKDFDYGWEADRYEVMKNRVDFTLGNGNRKNFVMQACAVTRASAQEKLGSLTGGRSSQVVSHHDEMRWEIARPIVRELREKKNSRSSGTPEILIEIYGKSVKAQVNGDDYPLGFCPVKDWGYEMWNMRDQWVLIKLALDETLAAIDGIGFSTAVEICDLDVRKNELEDSVASVLIRVYFA